MAKKSCWDIMECEGASKCIAKIYPEKMCWEHSQKIGSLQHHFSICPDCLVYLQHSLSSSVNYDVILKQRKAYSLKRKVTHKCPLSNYVEYRHAKVERRKHNRIACNGHLQASFINSDTFKLSCKIIDLSHTGLSFFCSDDDTITSKNIKIDLHLSDLDLTDLPVKIISNLPSTASTEARRYGGTFSHLSPDQESNLVNVLQACVTG